MVFFCVLNSSIKSKAEPELELEFHGASLFLAHLTVWLRMMNLQVTILALFPLFLQPCSHSYLTEFLEIGGAWIPLEILGLNHVKEEDKRESVKLLLLTGDTGRAYKEPIRESCGTVQTLTKFLNASNLAEGQKDAQVLLDSLGHSNPKHQSQDSQDLKAELLCTPARPSPGGLCWGQWAVLPHVHPSIPTLAGTELCLSPWHCGCAVQPYCLKRTPCRAVRRLSPSLCPFPPGI
uniref:Uncharacterized protein n=1 Tax=Zosterops lateralis melanops TaxID=1220523 RepID=A0A8D2PBE7_ZOSLA